MKLYNSQNNTTVETSENLAANRLRYNHVKDGGIYCRLEEIGEYFDLEPAEVKEGEQVVTTNEAPVEKPTPKVTVDTGLNAMNKAQLMELAIQKLDLSPAQARALKKDELIEALQKAN